MAFSHDRLRGVQHDVESNLNAGGGLLLTRIENRQPPSWREHPGSLRNALGQYRALKPYSTGGSGSQWNAVEGQNWTDPHLGIRRPRTRGQLHDFEGRHQISGRRAYDFLWEKLTNDKGR